MEGRQLARALGWFSLGLGLMELVAPRRMASQLGLRGRHRIVRGFGLRELVSGALILLDDGRSPKWLWARVAGDLLDLGVLETAHPYTRRRRRNLLAAKAAVVGATAMDTLTAQRVRRDQRWA
jgi:hypothetical protein